MIETTAPEPEHPAMPRASTERVNAIVSEDFSTFYDREIRSVVGLAYVLSGSRNGAEDLAQDAFVTAYRHWDRVGAYENPGAWVRRVAANRSISTGRRRIAEAKALLRLGGERIAIPELSIDNEDLWSAVRQLPPRQAQVIALRYWDRLSGREIAEILQLSEATVKSHLQRARQVLAQIYSKD
jgi:RNA polymerase sigma-70 factor (ECF subfamily)